MYRINIYLILTTTLGRRIKYFSHINQFLVTDAIRYCTLFFL